ncbi:MAG: RHS repeat-associated core domain-containing protein, partial [Bacteroidota bacterium]
MNSAIELFGYNNWSTAQKKDWTRFHYDVADPDFSPESGLNMEQTNLKGQLAYTESEEVKSWYSYDDRGRLHWMAQHFIGLNKTFTEEYTYGTNGLMSRIAFQSAIPDEAFYHHFTYDRDLRLDKVYTSTTGSLDDAYEHVNHEYFIHGPLKKEKYANGLQEVDYAYTIQGWLKAINGINTDPDFDGDNGTYPDVFGHVMDYHADDFQVVKNRYDWYEPPVSLPGIKTYHGGMLKSTRWKHLSMSDQKTLKTRLNAYEYDEEYQLTNTHYHRSGTFNKANNVFGEKDISYDLNGNIQSLSRYDSYGDVLNDFQGAYQYTDNGNQLTAVDKHIDQVIYNETGQVTGYDYHPSAGRPDVYFEYNGFSQVTGIYSDSEKTQKQYTYRYDDRGNRILKRNEETGIEEWYVYNFSNTLTGIYYKEGSTLTQGELMIGGRLGIAYKDIDHWQYNYALTDHLGNTRSVVSSLKFMATATMEEERVSYESTRFENLNTRQLDAANAIDGTYSALLNPALGSDQVVGPAKSLRVRKGDEVTISVLASYDPASSDNTFVTGLGGLVTRALGGTAQIGESAVASIPSAVSGDAFVPAPANKRTPKAYLQFLLFDDAFNFIGTESGGCECYQVVSEVAANGVETLTLTKEVEKDGYMYIYVSNESNNDVNVWFDNLTISHTGLNIIQQTDYYSYGGVATSTQQQNYRFGYQGVFAEKDQETGFDHFQLRSYDSEIGRWLAVDPYGQYWSPYLGMGNAPNMGIDPDGGWIFSSNSFVELGAVASLGAILGTFLNGKNGAWQGALGSLSLYGLGAGISELSESFYLTPLSTNLLRSIAIESGVNPQRPNFDRIIGDAFERAALDGVGARRNTRNIPTPARAAFGGRPRTRPDGFNDIKVFDPRNKRKVRVYANSSVYEVKARNGKIRLSSDLHQARGLLQIARNSQGGRVRRGQLTFVTTSNTTIGDDIIRQGNSSGVSVSQIVAFRVGKTNRIVLSPKIKLTTGSSISVPLPSIFNWPRKLKFR